MKIFQLKPHHFTKVADFGNYTDSDYYVTVDGDNYQIRLHRELVTEKLSLEDTIDFFCSLSETQP